MFDDMEDSKPMLGADDKSGGDKMEQAKGLYEQLENLLEGMGKDPVEWVKEQAAEDDQEDAAEGESEGQEDGPAAPEASAPGGDDKDAKKAIIVAMLKKKMKG